MTGETEGRLFKAVEVWPRDSTTTDEQNRHHWSQAWPSSWFAPAQFRPIDLEPPFTLAVEMSHEETAEKKPKVFVSYSWTSQEHVDRILAWCEQLVANAIDVEIDRWSLNEGHDKFAYMEKMVSDSSITHVLIFSDSRYAQKADARAKGVGTESQIISSEIYGRTTQEKFLPIVCEFDEHGEPCVPVFLRGRIYFNFSTPEAANENWEKLVRRIYNKPALTKPRLGRAPSYLEAGNAPASFTASKFAMLKDAIHKGRPNVRMWIADYGDAVVMQMEEHRLPTPPISAEDYTEKVYSSVEAMLPLRNELVEFFDLMLTALPATEAAEVVGDLLERLLPFKFPPANLSSYTDWWFDNFGFFLYELFLYAVAAHVRLKQFDGLAVLLGRRFIMPENVRGRVRARGIDVFRFHSKLFAHLNEKSQQRRLSMEADLVHRRATLAAYPMMMMMQSDLLCCLRAILHPAEIDMWPPLSIIYAEYLGTLELFLRAEEKRWFKKIAVALDVANKAELETKFSAWIEKYPRQLGWLFQYGDMSLEGLMGFEKLDTIGPS